MAPSDGVYRSDNAAGNELREDLLDIITDLSPKMTPLFTGLKSNVATQNLHQFLNDEVSRASSVSKAQEGGEIDYSDLQSPSRNTNYVQEIVEPYKVSTKSKDSDMAGYDDPESYFGGKAMATWKLKAEYALIWGTGISGSSGVAWEMVGLKKSITTNFTSYATGTSLTENRFNDLLETAYADVTDDTFEVYTSIGLKRAISAFTAGSTKNVDAEDKRLVNAVDVYEADVASMVKLFSHRDITNAKNLLLAIQPRAFAKAFMHTPEDVKVAHTGPFSAGYWYGSLTMEFLQEKAGVKGEGLVK